MALWKECGDMRDISNTCRPRERAVSLSPGQKPQSWYTMAAKGKSLGQTSASHVDHRGKKLDIQMAHTQKRCARADKRSLWSSAAIYLRRLFESFSLDRLSFVFGPMTMRLIDFVYENVFESRYSENSRADAFCFFKMTVSNFAYINGVLIRVCKGNRFNFSVKIWISIPNFITAFKILKSI